MLTKRLVSLWVYFSPKIQLNNQIAYLSALLLICGSISPVSVWGKALASVDGIPINSQRYFSHIERLHQTHSHVKDNQRLEDRLSKRALLPLVTELILKNEAKRLGVALDSLNVDDPILTLLKTYQTEERLESYLKRIGETKDSLRLKKWTDAVVMSLMNHAKLLDISKADVRAEYKRQEPYLKQSEKIKASQLLIKLPPKPTREQINLGFQAIQDLHQQFLKGESFNALVQRHSQGALRFRGGDMGFIAKGDMVRVVEDTIWSLKEGEVSTPIRSKYGWHLIKRGTRQAPSITSYKDVQHIFKKRLESAKFRRTKRGYLKKLWSAAKIDSSLPLRY